MWYAQKFVTSTKGDPRADNRAGFDPAFIFLLLASLSLLQACLVDLLSPTPPSNYHRTELHQRLPDSTMSTSMRDLISGEAELDDDEDDESFDEETGEGSKKPRAARIEDSSEDEDDEEDPEEARKVCIPRNVCPRKPTGLTQALPDSRGFYRR